jgi:hypothetical protein
VAERNARAKAIDKLIDRADTLAGAWGARARASTTLGQERALLRLYGVTGLDRAGRPLAGAAVDRWLASSRDGIAGGIALPFAMALIEYDLDPQQLALDVASGAIDLALEAELLHEQDRREMAIAESTKLVAAAVERVDSDRVARRELLALLGEAQRPWIGTTLAEPDVDGALDEAAELASAGYDLLRIEVPIGRELAARMEAAGVEVPEWRPGRDGPGQRGRSMVGDLDETDPAPSGSQRALARLRRTADGVAAQRRGYVRLGTAIPPLGVPEGAVVAAFERVDLVEADPVAEIVVGGVDPDRSLADHAFARRLHRRADTFVSIGPGPLVVAPDLATGVPSDPATRSGRALALQLLGVALARADGLGADRLVVGAYPEWLAEEPSAMARVLAEVDVRRAIFPDHVIRFDEPARDSRSSVAWPFVIGAALPRVGPMALIMRRAHAGGAAAVVQARAAARIAADVAAVSEPSALRGIAEDHAKAMLAAATTTLERLSDLGWRAVVGDPPRAAGRSSEGRSYQPIGGDAVAERTESFDPLKAFDPG